tara:strand:- start:277 stop:663 length:387 start_codon:yes stop_codon:yes gene_type:complete
MGYKAKPITHKASRSCLQANQALIDGAADLGDSKAFQNYGDLVEDKFGEGQSTGAVDVETEDSEDPSPTKLDPVTIMKFASMASSMAGGNKKKEGGSKTTVVVKNNGGESRTPQSPQSSQAANAIDPV